jgi:glycolate oxidase subunit GlcD
MKELVNKIETIVGPENVLANESDLLAYEFDGLTLFSGCPLAVALPKTTKEISSIVRLCREASVPFVPRGAGTGLSGGAVAIEGGIVIECQRMNQILKIDEADRYAVVQPGVVNAELSDAVGHLGLFYAPDPSSQQACTIGGNVAENSGGPHTLKYGTTTNHVLELELVLPDGEIVRLGCPAGGSVGFDFLGAMVGSEGTLGIVTEVTVRLTPLPEKVETLLGVFPDIVSACRAVGEILRSGLTPASLEISDQRTIRAVESSVYAAGIPTDAGAVLLIELDGIKEAVERQADRVSEIAIGCGASRIEVAKDEAERQRFWRARKGAFGAMGRLAPDLFVHDAVVPRKHLPEILRKICEIADHYGITLSNVFHAGDGNLHPNISFDRRDPEELKRVIAAGEEILRLCVDAGGVITGEHGIGIEKKEYLHLVFSESDLAAMSLLRDVFDPGRVCNPGKIFPTTRFCTEANPKARGYDRVPFS